MYKAYIEELKDTRIPGRDGAHLIGILVDFSTTNTSLLDEYKVEVIVFFILPVLFV